MISPDQYQQIINKIIFGYLWIGKYSQEKLPDKIRTTVSADITLGGLKMIDCLIGYLNKSFVLDWVRKIKTNTNTAVSNIPMFYYKKLGGIEVFNSNTNVKSFNGLQYIEPYFWKYALQTWLKYKQIVKENEIQHVK